MNVGVRTRPGVNGKPVIVAAWCGTCRQESMPNRSGRCGWCDRKIVKAPLEGAGHPLPQAVPPAPSSGAIQASEPTTEPQPVETPSVSRLDGDGTPCRPGSGAPLAPTGGAAA